MTSGPEIDVGGDFVQFGILGPIRVAGEQQIPVPAARLRVLLAALLRHAGQPVAADELCELLWEEAALKDASGALRTLVRRLRVVLGPQAGARVVTRAPGYLIRVAEDELDSSRFEVLCREAAQAARADNWLQVAETCDAALALWRGQPLMDVPCSALRAEWVPRLEQSQLRAIEWRIEADLRTGRYEGVVERLQDLTTRHPLRERFHAQLMLALTGTGRRAEALDAYRKARRILVDELGVEPGSELRRIHEDVLAGGDEIRPVLRGSIPQTQPPDELTSARPPGAEGSLPAPRPQGPRQLPAAVRHFTGRRVELEFLARLSKPSDVGGDDAGEGAVVIAAIDGLAGVGKTALAVRAGHLLAADYPDGQLFVDLHGHAEAHPPRSVLEALSFLLRSLGVAPERIPRDVEECSAFYRQRLAGTRTLILLDDARDEGQVLPLVPGTGGCLVLVTSRSRLRGLHDAVAVPLDTLPTDDAVALVSAVAGDERAPRDNPALVEIAESCGRLPLALRVAASLLVHRPAWTLQYLAGVLRDEDTRNTILDGGTPSLHALLDVSLGVLDPLRRRCFRSLGLICGPDFDAYAVAALIAADPASSHQLLESLEDHNLLMQHVPGRYRLHDLLRARARSLAAADPVSETSAALDRLLYYYAYTARTASAPFARYPRAAPSGPAPAHLPFDLTARSNPGQARAWLRTELPNLEAAFRHARIDALDAHAVALAAGMAEILFTDGPWAAALDVHTAAADAAGRLADPAARAGALHDVGRARYLAGDYPGAGAALTQALELYRALGSRDGEADALTDLGHLRHLVGDCAEADRILAQALELYRALARRDGEANVLTELGHLRHMTGDYPGAGEAHAGALELYRALGHSTGQGSALTNLGLVRFQTGDLPAADKAFSRSLDLFRALGHHHGMANALNYLGRVRQQTGRFSEAEDALTQALELYRVLGNRVGEADVLRALGDLRLEREDYPGAGAVCTRALQVSRSIGHRLGEANALCKLGIVRRRTGDMSASADYLVQALDLYRALGHRGNEAFALNHYAATLAASGSRDHALTLYQQALAMNRELAKPDDEAHSLEGIAEYHLAHGDRTAGEAFLRQALAIHRRIGSSADEARVLRRLEERRTQ